MEYRARIDRFLKEIDRLGGSGAVITSPANVFYLSGFTGEGMLVLTKARLCLVTDARYTLQAAQESPDFEVLSWNEKSITAQQKLFFEDTYMSVAMLKRLQPENGEWLPLGDMLLKQRQTKSVAELSAITEAVRLADEAFAYTVERIHAGMREFEVAAMLEGYMRRTAGAKPSFDTICASGLRGALPHGTASDKVLEKGELVVLDFGCLLHGYCSDMTRTVCIGTADARQKEIYNVVLYAQTRAEHALTCGMSGKAADAVARDVIKSFGYGDRFDHSLGHGVGVEIHEYPNASPKSDHILSAGSVVTVEPGIYIPDFGGVRIEDMVYLAEGGNAILTKSPKTLMEI